METDPVSETLFSSIYNSGRWTKSRNPVTLSVIHHRQNTSDSNGYEEKPSSGAWHRVNFRRTDVSEERIAFNFRVEKKRERENVGATSQKTAFFIIIAVKTSNHALATSFASEADSRVL
jgi:hypothetical protein